MVWAGLALGLQNYVFDAVRPEDRAKGIAVCNTINAMGWFAGAMLGSWLATVVPAQFTLAGIEFSLASNLQAVFFISGLLRLLVSFGLLRTFRETRSVEPITHRQLVTELPFVKPFTDVFVGRESRQ
jgi:MFS family permease